MQIKVIVLSLALFMVWQTAQADAPWILVDSHNRSLTVFKDGETKLQFENISTGRNGVADFRLEGDGSTPSGSYRVTWVNRNSDYLLFFGLNYPNKQHAEVALRKRLIDVDTYFKIVKAEYNHHIPPQNTALGGQIGIHGLGKESDRRVHKFFNWTKGCVAVTDEQIRALDRWIRIGTRVVIR